MPPTRNDAEIDSCGLRNFEWNRFFHGKMVTARDWQSEQDSTRGALETASRFDLGAGVGCELDPTVTEAESGVTVHLEPGIAWDSCGRMIVVPHDVEETMTPRGTGDDRILHLGIRYAECNTEKVPKVGSEDACGEECTYNRFRETYELVSMDGPPAHERIPDIDFPEKKEFPDETPSPSPGENALPDEEKERREERRMALLNRMARSFYEADSLSGSGSSGETPVYLGSFEPSGDERTEWKPTSDDQPKQVAARGVANRAITVRHATDYGNPHESFLSVTEPEDGDTSDFEAFINVEGANPETDIGLDATGGLSIVPDPEGRAITFDVTGDTGDGPNLAEVERRLGALEDRVDSLQRYAMRHSLEYTVEAFANVAVRFNNQTAGNIAEQASKALDDGVYREAGRYLIVVGKLHESEAKLRDELRPRIWLLRYRGWSAYSNAVDDLGTLISENDREQNVLRTAVAQDEVSEAAKRLGYAAVPPFEIPDVIRIPEEVVRPPILRDDFFGPAKVPDLVRRPKEEAEIDLIRNGWRYEVVTRSVDDPRTITGTGVNEVIEISPEPGEEVTKDTVITLTVLEPPSTTRIEGIGDAYRDDLAEFGIASVGELARADIDVIVAATNVDRNRARTWKDNAELFADAYELTRVDGLGIDEAEILARGADVNSLGDLRNSDETEIVARIDDAIDSNVVRENARTTVTNLDWSHIRDSLDSLNIR